MGIAFPVRERVMLAMDGHPLLAALPGREPENRPKHNIGKWVDHQRPMREGPVQIDRCRDDGDLRQHDGDEGGDPNLS